ncbi:hypothetical protein [Streptomyces gobiensis]|uniref:hypothetical protein n=1 Tax=Streptomyces gobiensis TaxID=2875706 RepID=UPI001E2E6315|nr:hypothetical protein [Streptomyces gobiensis]UGY90499.1 hypothetical protein test1122_01330 [Streptomyces gobiensis]
MQPSAGSASFPPPPRPDLPHTRARTVHWLATAAALGAVLGATALVQPSDATATPAGPVGTPSAATGPDPAKAAYPIDCGPWDVAVIDQAAIDFDGDGQYETVAVVRCATGTGTPPSGMYVLAQPADGTGEPRVAETLVDPAEQLTVENFTVRGRTIAAKLRGYSSDDVPRCCPDMERDVKWDWEDGKFALRAAPLTGSV